MMNFRLTDQELAVLRSAHRTQRDRRFADRIKAIVHLGNGWSVAQVAEALLVDEKTIYLWLEKYHQGGKDEVLTLCYSGKESLLSEHQQQELAKHLDERTYLTSKEICCYVKKKYNVHYSLSGMKDLLHRLGFSYKKPVHVPGKLDGAAQKAFVAKYRRLRKNRGEHDPILFADACHPQHNSVPAYGWIRRGKEKLLKSNGGRRRVNIHGAVNIDSMDIMTDFVKSVNKESSLRLFQKIEKRYPKATKILIIVDTASYYTARWLRERLEGSKIRLHFLPGHSPNLNLIERLWKFFKKEILYNTYYEKFEDFLSACKNFFRCRTKYREKLRSLLSEKFQLYKNA